MEKIIKLYREPHQCVEIGGVEIWKNRAPEEWHLKFPPVKSNQLGDCPDGNCGCMMHAIEDPLFFDPHCLPVLSKLKPGMKILVLMESSSKAHVSFFTFNGMCSSLEHLQIYSLEESKDREFFTPYRRKPTNGHRISIYWHKVKYLAIVESKEKPFGKLGGRECFQEELARLSGISKDDLEDALHRLDQLNPKPGKPSLKLVTGTARIIAEDFGKGKDVTDYLSGVEGQYIGIQ